MDKCDVCVIREDRKKINVWVYVESIGNIGFVYKIGVIIDVMKGSIFSFEWYEWVFDSDWMFIFFV